MSKPLFTIALPTYNNEKTIYDALLSCLDQDTEIPFEVLVVNNASHDNTENIIRQFDDKRLRILNNKETVPLFKNHNVCIENALGEYVIFCHSDDSLQNHAIETFAKKIKERGYPKKYIVWGHSMFRDFSLHIRNAGFSMNEMIVGESAPLIFLYGGLAPVGTCYSRDSFLEAGGFIEVERSSPSDMTSMIALAMDGFRFEMIDEMIFNREYASTSVAGNEEAYLEDLDDAFKYFIQQRDSGDINKLLKLPVGKKKPLRFLYAIAQDEYYKNKIRKTVAKYIIMHPLELRKTVVRKLIKRLYM